jgi:hypothetical protein
MKVLLKSLIGGAAIFLACAYSSSALADGGRKIIHFDCQAGNFLHVRTMVLYDIAPLLDKRTFDLAKLTKEQRKQECRISDSVKATAYLGGDGGQILLNKKLVGGYSFQDPNRIYDYLIMNTPQGIVDIVSSEIREETKTTTTHFDPNTNN